GRSPSGNFLITDLILRAKAPGAEKVVELKPKAAGATFEQEGQPASGVVDDNESSGWSVGSRVGQDHAAVFEFEKPLTNDGGLTLTFVFDFKKNKQHALGRFRVSVCEVGAKATVET